MTKACILIAALVCAAPALCRAQPFYFGNDLSYANQMEDCGAVFKENGAPKDVYRIFADHGTNLVRLRLWVDPSWQNALAQPPGVRAQYSDFADVKEAIGRAKAAGMQVLLDFHYSDFWADPGRQVVPARWAGVAHDTEALADSVYRYTRRVLGDLDAEGLMPEVVQVGNETNAGMLLYTGMDARYNPTGLVSWDWGRQAVLFNAAIRAVREAGAAASIDPRIAVHFADPSRVKGLVRLLMNAGATDFDLIGFSYYYAWHERSIAYLGAAIRDLKASFPGYDVMVLETGYLWTTQNVDGLGNIITTPDPAYLPVIPEKQLEYMVDYTREVMRSGGAGVVFWEPAWVSTPCRTPWGQGSSHDHVAFFEPGTYDFMGNGGGRWTEPRFYEDPHARKVTFRVDMSGHDVSGGVYVTGSFTGDDWQILPMADEGNDIYSYFTYLPAGATGAYHFLNAADEGARETVPAACAAWEGTDRAYAVAEEDAVFAYRWGSCRAIGGSTPVEQGALPPSRFMLHPGYPNPFNPSTTLTYELPRPAHVRLTVHDALGRELAALVDARVGAGRHEARFDAARLPSGVYLARIEAGVFTSTTKLILLR